MNFSYTTLGQHVTPHGRVYERGPNSPALCGQRERLQCRRFAEVPGAGGTGCAARSQGRRVEAYLADHLMDLDMLSIAPQTARGVNE